MNKCISCGGSLSPLNGSEENDFAIECEYCEEHEEEIDDYECEHFGGDNDQKPMTVEEMQKRWPECPPNKAELITFSICWTGKNIGFEINQDTIKEIREYLDAIEEAMSG